MPRKFDVGDSEGFGALPGDIYTVRVQKVELTTSKSGQNVGTEGYLFTFEVIDNDKYEGRLLWDRLWFLPQNGWTWIRTLSALIPSQEWKGEIDVPDPYDLVGLKCKVEVSEGEYNGKPKNDIENYYPLNEDGGQFSGGFGDEPF